MDAKQELVVITDGTITVYKKDGTLVGTATSEGGGNYRSSNLEEGDYYYIASAPTRGTVIRDFKLPVPTDIDTVIKNITIEMVAGVDNIPVTVKDKDDAAITSNISVKIARIDGVHDTGGIYDVANVPIGAQVLELIPAAGFEATYQNYKRTYSVAQGLTISEILYPPVDIQIRVVDRNGVDIPGAQLYLSSSLDSTKEIYKTSGLFRLLRQADHNMILSASAPNHTTVLGATRVVSYLNSVNLGTPGNQSFTITLSPAVFSDGNIDIAKS